MLLLVIIMRRVLRGIIKSGNESGSNNNNNPNAALHLRRRWVHIHCIEYAALCERKGYCERQDANEDDAVMVMMVLVLWLQQQHWNIIHLTNFFNTENSTHDAMWWWWWLKNVKERHRQRGRERCFSVVANVMMGMLVFVLSLCFSLTHMKCLKRSFFFACPPPVVVVVACL